MNKQPAYEASHPVAVALGGMVRALRSGADLLEALAEQARRVGVAPFSPEFDEAAALAGMPYSRAWDAYLDRETWAQAERQPLAHIHCVWCQRPGSEQRPRCPGRASEGRPTRTTLLFHAVARRRAPIDSQKVT